MCSKQNGRCKFFNMIIINVFNLMIRVNESKTLTKHTSRQCKCKFDGKKCKSHKKWNKDNCQCECKNPREYVCGKDYIWNPRTF